MNGLDYEKQSVARIENYERLKGNQIGFYRYTGNCTQVRKNVGLLLEQVSVLMMRNMDCTNALKASSLPVSISKLCSYASQESLTERLEGDK